MQKMFEVLPGKTRCLQCHVPLSGAGTIVAKPLGFRPSVLTPRLQLKGITSPVSARAMTVSSESQAVPGDPYPMSPSGDCKEPIANCHT